MVSRLVAGDRVLHAVYGYGTVIISRYTDRDGFITRVRLDIQGATIWLATDELVPV